MVVHTDEIRPFQITYLGDLLSSWWMNQPLWKICSSNWIISPGIGVKIQMFETTTKLSIIDMTVRDHTPPKTNECPLKNAATGRLRFIFWVMAPFLGDIRSLVGGFSPTHLKNMRKSNWIISPKIGLKIKKHVQPPPTLRIIGPSYRGVWICMTQGLGISKPLWLEIPWFLG